ncbi:MAG: AmmeMemoRadiSam system protein B [candidate division Zixibacteria bacterium]|nr:AmmeMemoRadiSam system protein B [candidate division Zixibacteria bacterium]MDH3936440.1 AmmeMemoRadiSam system protein B [candidate division Zixibacteria bacterium]MDH4032621.1 AmmeMemoRadiSam system protein B [candidate division Zixibacteria bacterium]
MDDTEREIRKPAVAGMFYPKAPGELAKMIAGFFAEVDKPAVGGHPIGLIAPHAGYPYSGRLAARAYKLLDGHQFDSVVIISPSHTVFFQGAAVYDGHAYETPLGLVEIDQDLSSDLSTIHPSVYASRKGHATGSARGEHALEVQLPFLQVVLGRFKLVAIVMGDQEEDTTRALGEVLASGLRGTNSLLIASTDLSHFHGEKEARKLDATVQAAVDKFDPGLLMRTLENGKGEACGGGPMAAVMAAAKRLGGTEVGFTDYTTSGATTGDFDNVVGYLAAAITGAKPEVVDRSMMGVQAAKPEMQEVSNLDRPRLHQIARDAIMARLQGKSYTPPVIESLDKKRGLFVTLTIDGRLRGCIGQIRAQEPLYEAVAEMAQAAAFEDPRFPELSKDEASQIETEISVLSPLVRVHDFDEIEVGRHGLMIKLEMHSGLLLPQVATEHGWDRIQFLEETCMKAGLSRNSYKDRLAEIYKFAGEVF